MRMRAATWAGAGLFLASLLYFAWFYLVWLGQPATVPPDRVPGALAVNIALFSAFALHHSIFARTGAKALVKRLLPPSLERVAYVWVASLLLIAVCLLWQPLPGIAWQATGAVRWGLFAVQIAGIVLTLRSASRIDVWELAGVKPFDSAMSQTPRSPRLGSGEPPRSGQAGDSWSVSTAPSASSPLEVGGPYRWLRHPIYFGWVLLVFGAPTMTGGRLLFAGISTLYLIVAIPFEERGLQAEFGQAYRDYQRRVRWRLVPGVW
jgi:protein-S-isoprenylcysteine O-methyltransferase Ste14